MLKALPLLFFVILLSACKEQQDVNIDKLNAEQKIGYAMGSNLGTQLRMNIEQHAEVGMPVDIEMLFRGIQDGLDDYSALEASESNAIILDFQNRYLAREAEIEKSILARADASGQRFLAENSKKDGVITLPSGLQYKVLKLGDGNKPTSSSKVRVDYSGKLIDGHEFDSSYKRGEAAEFPLNGVIKGWTEGLQLMPEGSEYRFFIPSNLAYGSRQVSSIPANSTLIFDVVLIEIVD